MHERLEAAFACTRANQAIVIDRHRASHGKPGKVGPAEMQINANRGQDEQCHRVAEHRDRYIERAKGNRRGMQSQPHVVVPINHRIFGIVGDGPENICRQQPPCNRRHRAMHGRKRHRNTETKCHPEIRLRQGEKSLGVRVGQRQKQRHHREHPHQFIHLNDQHECRQRQQRSQHPGLFPAYLARSQRTVLRPLHMLVEVTIGVVIDDATGRAHQQRAKRKNPDHEPGRLASRGNPKRPQRRP